MKFTAKKLLSAALALAMLAGLSSSAFAAGIRSIKDLPPPEGDGFSFLLAGDPQIGAGGLESNTAGWTGSLTNALAQWDDAAFLVTLGDNISTKNEAAQLEGFTAPLVSLGLAVAPTPGNHDGKEILDNFDLPNRDNYGNYWYTYDGALFMHLNSDNFIMRFTAVNFMRSAIQANPDASWKFVVLHHAVYTSSNDFFSQLLALGRSLFYGPLFELLEIDVAFMGHDHVYLRTKPIKLWVPSESGTTYLSLSSSSGSKYYDVASKDFYFTAAQMQPKAPMLSKVDVTPQKLTLTTCRTDTMEVLDSCVIAK